MTEEPLRDAAYATMALHQRLSLDEIAAGAADRTFPARDLSAPNWFAAAAGSGSRLDEVAPELRIEPATTEDDRLDLIRMYAPELQVETEVTPPPLEPDEGRDRGVRIELLHALAELDE
jgi:hypothetical protein